MAKKNGMDDDQMMENYEENNNLDYDDQGEELDFAGEDDLLDDEEEDEDVTPSVLYKGVSRPKTDEDWRELLLEASPEGVPTYALGDSYQDGDLIMHPEFGIGVVSKVITSRKMEVIFETSKKLMAMNIIPPQ